MKFIMFFYIFLINPANAELLKRNEAGDFTLTKNQYKVSELLADYGRLMGYNLSVAKDLKDSHFISQGELVIPKEQIESYVSSILTYNGSAIIRMPDSKFVQVIDARDIRYTTLPIYTNLDQIPANDNQAQWSYALKYLKSSELSRNMRPFLSRYGRIIDVVKSNTIHMTDTGNNLRRVAQIAIHLDTAEYQKDKNEMEKINEKYKQAKIKGKTFLEILSQNQSIFILIFFLIGSIIGFGTRGYMIKKVEGGW